MTLFYDTPSFLALQIGLLTTQLVFLGLFCVIVYRAWLLQRVVKCVASSRATQPQQSPRSMTESRLSTMVSEMSIIQRSLSTRSSALAQQESQQMTVINRTGMVVCPFTIVCGLVMILDPASVRSW